MALRTRIASLLALSTGALLAQTAGPAQAQPNPEGDAPIGVLLAVGDIAQCGKSESQQHDEAVAEIVAQEIERAEAEDLPLRLLLLGDLAYGDGSREQFDQCFDPAWGRFKDVSMPVPGNHKYHQPEATPYFRYFRKAPLMADGEPLVASEGARAGFYTVRFPEPEGGPWLLLGLNSGEEGEVERPGWLRNVLEENQAAGAGGARCVLAFSHDFLFSSGAHGHGYEKSDPAAPLEPGDGMRRAFDLLDRFGASVLLSGHDHHFEQFAPQDAKGNADPEGLRSFIVGTGGGDAYLEEVGFTYEEQAANQEFIDGSHFGVLRIELFADRYTWSFVREGGEVVEPEPHEAECQEPLPPCGDCGHDAFGGVACRRGVGLDGNQGHPSAAVPARIGGAPAQPPDEGAGRMAWPMDGTARGVVPYDPAEMRPRCISPEPAERRRRDDPFGSRALEFGRGMHYMDSRWAARSEFGG